MPGIVFSAETLSQEQVPSGLPVARQFSTEPKVC